MKASTRNLLESALGIRFNSDGTYVPALTSIEKKNVVYERTENKVEFHDNKLYMMIGRTRFV